MYSEKLRNEKIVKENGEAFVGIEVGEKEICKMIDEFCTKEDILNVPTPKLKRFIKGTCYIITDILIGEFCAVIRLYCLNSKRKCLYQHF